MRMFFSMLFALISVSAYATSDVELARQARDLLSHPKHAAGFVEEERCFQIKADPKKVCKKELKSLDVMLAIRREGDKSFTFIEAAGSGPNLCVSKTTGFDTKCYVNHYGATNGVNTEFEIEYPKGYKVYAIRRVVNDPTGRKEVVYTPYSDKLNVRSVRLAGQRYVNDVIDRALRLLRERGVRSRIDSTKLVADLASKEVLHQLAIIEHIDHFRFEREPFRKLVREVYTIYGLNQDLSYNYAVSSADARGIFQVIPDTYQKMTGTYPLAQLKEDFVTGMRDHVNAAMAAILLADHDVGLVPKAMRSTLTGSQLGEYIASSYNGGPARPIRILKAGGNLVDHNQNPENKTYILKMRATTAILK